MSDYTTGPWEYVKPSPGSSCPSITSDEQLMTAKALVSNSDNLLCVGLCMAHHLASYKMAARSAIAKAEGK